MPKAKDEQKTNENVFESKVEEINRNVSDVKNLTELLGKRIEVNEKNFSEIGNSLTAILNEMANKGGMVEIKGEDVTNQNSKKFYRKFDDMENKLDSLGNDLSVLQGNLMALEQNVSDVKNSVSDFQETKVVVEKRLRFDENMIDSLQKELVKTKSNLTEVIKKHPKSDASELTKKVNSLENELVNIKSSKPEDTTKEMIERINLIEGKIEAIRASAVFDEQLSEIINRLVFLESRFAALESMMQKVSKYSPIVVE